MVYSKVRGPGTVGLDASASPEEVLSTALEALDYYGVYNISREYDPHYVAPMPQPAAPAHTAPAPAQAVHAATAASELKRDPLTARSATSTCTSAGTAGPGAVTGAASKTGHRTSRRSSIGPGLKKAVYSADENSFGSFSPENDDPQLFPELPDELIANRRISMGVYGMFTKL